VQSAPTAPPLTNETPNPSPFIKHEVRDTDTLPGIALKYNTTTQAIKQLNKLASDHVFTRRYLYIPHDGQTPLPEQTPDEVSETTVRRRLLKDFMKASKISSKEEAEYYLDESDWNLEMALEVYQKDIEWEKQNANTVQ